MALDLYTVKEDFATMVQRVQPWTLSQFVMWLDLKVAEYKVYGYMILDFEDRISQFFNNDFRREVLKKPQIAPKRTAPIMQLLSRQDISGTSPSSLECPQGMMPSNLESRAHRVQEWPLPLQAASQSQVSQGPEGVQKEVSVSSRPCPTALIRHRVTNQNENDPTSEDSHMDLVMDVESAGENVGADVNWTSSQAEQISNPSVYHKNSSAYHEELPSYKNTSAYCNKETSDSRKETPDYSKETRTTRSSSKESSHRKPSNDQCGVTLPATEIKVEDFENDEGENANFTMTVENSSSSNSLVETNDYLRIEENSAASSLFGFNSAAPQELSEAIGTISGRVITDHDSSAHRHSDLHAVPAYTAQAGQPKFHIIPIERNGKDNLEEKMDQIMKLLDTSIEQQKEILAKIEPTSSEIQEKRRRKMSIEVPGRIRSAVYDGYRSGTEKNLTWKRNSASISGTLLKYDSPENRPLSEYIMMFVRGLYPDVEPGIIAEAVKTYFISFKQREFRRQTGKDDAHKKSMTSYERKKRKMCKRRAAVNEVASWTASFKNKVQGSLLLDFMSSDEEHMSDQEIYFVNKPLPWRSDEFSSAMEELDRKAITMQSVRSQRQTSRRVKGLIPSSRPAPAVSKDHDWVII